MTPNKIDNIKNLYKEIKKKTDLNKGNYKNRSIKVMGSLWNYS